MAGWRKSGNLTGFGLVHDGSNGAVQIDFVDNINKVISVNRFNITPSLKFRPPSHEGHEVMTSILLKLLPRSRHKQEADPAGRN